MSDMQTVKVLSLGEETPAGNIYTIESFENFRNPETGAYFEDLQEVLGEYDQKFGSGGEGLTKRILSIDMQRVCLKATNIRFDENQTALLCDVKPHVPLGDRLPEDISVSMRSTIHKSDTAIKVKRIVAFDLSPNTPIDFDATVEPSMSREEFIAQSACYFSLKGNAPPHVAYKLAVACYENDPEDANDPLASVDTEMSYWES